MHDDLVRQVAELRPRGHQALADRDRAVVVMSSTARSVDRLGVQLLHSPHR